MLNVLSEIICPHVLVVKASLVTHTHSVIRDVSDNHTMKFLVRKSLNCIFQIHSALYEEPEINRNPCNPSPCGPNSLCRAKNNQAVCTCIDNYIGQPPNCRPECVLSSECPIDKSCERQKCVNPCLTACGDDTNCRVHNHSPICTCKVNYMGDPFTRCYYSPRKFPFLCFPRRKSKNEYFQ